MLTFLVLGAVGLKSFRRAITNTEDRFTSDSLDNGISIKQEILDWLTRLAGINARAEEIVSLLKQMLAQGSKRPTARLVWKELLKVCICSLSTRSVGDIRASMLLIC